MGVTVATRRIRHDYGRPGVVTPERWLARELGRTPAGVHQLLAAPFRSGLTLPHLTALCITSFVETGADERLTRWVQPIRSALARIRTVPLSPELIREAQLVDLEEDMVEAEYHAAKTDANARRWVAWIDRCVDYLLKLRASLVAEHKLEDQ
jgi:hypothetical protein